MPGHTAAARATKVTKSRRRMAPQGHAQSDARTLTL
jgi:hypothetical protein